MHRRQRSVLGRRPPAEREGHPASPEKVTIRPLLRVPRQQKRMPRGCPATVPSHTAIITPVLSTTSELASSPLGTLPSTAIDSRQVTTGMEDRMTWFRLSEMSMRLMLFREMPQARKAPMPSRPRHCRRTGSGPPPLPLLLRARHSSRGRRARKQKAMCDAVRKKGNRNPYTPSAYLQPRGGCASAGGGGALSCRTRTQIRQQLTCSGGSGSC